MSIYANSSEQYWRERKKKDGKRRILIVVALSFLLLCAVSLKVSSAKTRRAKQEDAESAKLARRKLLLIRPNATEAHVQQCEARIHENARGGADECDSLCNNERNSLPRPTMHQACLHACQGSLSKAAEEGCRENGTEEGAFGRAGSAYEKCFKFQNTLPKPEVFSTCRKYFREGVRRGYHMGRDYLDDILNTEWDVRRGWLEDELLHEA
uniref:Uncharacterized protein n=1 Tax=Odontella aurita TaxID=265563 RepID=A0A7S4MWD0_9STRA|mmetsp:Transcript_35191/g.105115  ORF Transcript_35191/g.105115 Transcript_35191/m.105115 type:complete len:210 (+) Transcript_35191:535-1164(+)